MFSVIERYETKGRYPILYQELFRIYKIGNFEIFRKGMGKLQELGGPIEGDSH